MCTDAFEDSNGNYYVTAMQRDYSPAYRTTLILKINMYGDTVKSLPLSSAHGDLLISRLVNVNNQYFVGLGKVNTDTSTNLNIIYYKFDLDLNILDEKQYYTPFSYFDTRKAIVNSKNNIVCTGNGSKNPSPLYDIFMYEVSVDGILQKYKRYPYSGSEFATDILENNSKNGYNVYITGLSEIVNSMGQIMAVDTLLNITGFDSIPRQLYDMVTAKWFSSEKFLLTGKKNYFNVNGPTDIDLGILMLDTTHNVVHENYFGRPDTVDFIASYQNLDFTNRNSIFFAGSINFDVYQHPFSNAPSWIIVNNLDSTLNLRWQKIFGGDAYYYVESILATSDGGCLLLGDRYDHLAQNDLREIYILKVDENGNIAPTSTNPGEIMPIEVIVYPNPCASTLYIQATEQCKSSTFAIYDFTGRQMLSKSISGSSAQIDVSGLQRGMYLYRMVSNGKVIGSGKFVKE